MAPSSLLVAVLALAFLLLLGVVQRRWGAAFGRPSAPSLSPESEEIPISAEPDLPLGFGRKNSWIAVRADGPEAVAEALGLSGVEPCNWRSGLRAGYAYGGDYVFVTPPVDGWVLAVGGGLPEISDPAAVAAYRETMSELSKRFGAAWIFATHRVSSYTAWACYEEGSERRLFAQADDPIHDLGAPSRGGGPPGSPPGLDIHEG